MKTEAIMKPKTRAQNFLAKIAGDANADTTMKPRTAEEYFLNQIAENGGSSLPSYYSSDIGKVLAVGATYSDTAVEFFPKQTVTFTDGRGTLTDVKRTPESLSVGTRMELGVREGQSGIFTPHNLTYTYNSLLETNVFIPTDATNFEIVYAGGAWRILKKAGGSTTYDMFAEIYDVTGVTVGWAEIPSASETP